MWLLGASFDLLWGYSLGWALCGKVRAPPAAALGKNHRCSASSQLLLLCCKACMSRHIWSIYGIYAISRHVYQLPLLLFCSGLRRDFTLQGGDSDELAASA